MAAVFVEDWSESEEYSEDSDSMSGSDDLPYYRHTWEHLADCQLTIGEKEDEKKTFGLALSRAYIRDWDLVRQGDRKESGKKVEEQMGEMALDLKEPSDVENEKPAGVSEVKEGEADVTDPLHPSQLTPDAWAELPKEFGQTKFSNELARQNQYKKYNKHDDAAAWLNRTSFDEYWEWTKCFICYKSWLLDFGPSMEEEIRQNLKKQVDEYRPDPKLVKLISEHHDENLETAYKGLAAAEPTYASLKTYEEIFALHCEAVKKKAEADFAGFKRALVGHRCQTFFNKMKNMGFVGGEKVVDMDTVAATKESPSKLENKRSSSLAGGDHPDAKRRMMVYSVNEPFSDIHYDIFDPHMAKMQCVVGKKAEKPEDSEEGGEKPRLPDVPTDPSEVSFTFDPEKESHLLASNAKEYYQEDKDIRKYFYQRYRLFSRLDKGIIMDREGWFSVTPERIAEHIADRCVIRKGMVIVDAFAGVGGNSIQFALKGARVIAIDLDPTRLKCARHNAQVYGVEDRIEFICCNFFHFAAKWTQKKEEKRQQIDAVFLSPPWGGPGYIQTEVFDIGADMTPNGYDIFNASKAMSPNIAYFLPRNTAVEQLRSLLSPGERVEIEQSCLNSKIKTITAYYGELAYAPIADEEEEEGEIREENEQPEEGEL